VSYLSAAVVAVAASMGDNKNSNVQKIVNFCLPRQVMPGLLGWMHWFIARVNKTLTATMQPLLARRQITGWYYCRFSF
jgi:hypothetical protein